MWDLQSERLEFFVLSDGVLVLVGSVECRVRVSTAAIGIVMGLMGLAMGMAPTLSAVQEAVEDAATISRVNRKRQTLHVYKRDEPRKYEVTIEDGQVQVVTIDTTGGGKIGGLLFEEAVEAAGHMQSI